MSNELTTENKSKKAEVSVKKYVLKKQSNSSTQFLIDYENELNKAQLEAATTLNGSLLVIAGAGSGKTRTLVYRLARLIETGVNPENILLLTFTKKSAAEMLNRASLILDSRCEKVAGGTFHSFANLVLRKYSSKLQLKNSFTIMDRSDAEDAVNLIRSEYVNTKEKRFPRKGTILDIHSKAINKNTEAKLLIEQEYSQFTQSTDQIIEICRRYNEYKRGNSLLDYDDLLLYLKTLLVSDEKLRKKLSNQYKYIMIDEYQDTNTLQADIIKLLASEHNNVMAVGDDAQSIYSFRGANFKNIMKFPDIFPNTKIIKLEENYRSTTEILDLSNEIISNAVEKYDKTLFSNIKNGELPAMVVCPDNKAESAFVTQRILELCEEGLSLNDIAVLARSARSTYDLEIELNKKSIPFKKFGGYKFIETAHIKDVISYLRIVVNNEDKISWNRVLLLIQGIGQTTGTKLLPIVGSDEPISKKLLPAPSKSKSSLEKLLTLVNTIKSNHYTPSEAVNVILEYYHPILAEKYDDFKKREKDLEHFQYLAESYNNLEKFLSDLALEPPDSSVNEIDGAKNEDEYLTVSTIHSAKGLEWKAVFIIGTVDGRFPSVFSFNTQDDLEEERRLMYVAITRAKSYLYLSYPIDMFDYSLSMVLSKPSRFLDNVSPDILEKWCIEEE